MRRLTLSLLLLAAAATSACAADASKGEALAKRWRCDSPHCSIGPATELYKGATVLGRRQQARLL